MCAPVAGHYVVGNAYRSCVSSHACCPPKCPSVPVALFAPGSFDRPLQNWLPTLQTKFDLQIAMWVTVSASIGFSLSLHCFLPAVGRWCIVSRDRFVDVSRISLVSVLLGPASPVSIFSEVCSFATHFLLIVENRRCCVLFALPRTLCVHVSLEVVGRRNWVGART